MTNEPLGVGIIGAGFGVLVQVPAFRSLPNVSVIGIGARDAGRTAAGEDILPWRQLIDDPRVRIVSVASPPSTHREIVAAALTAGKAVLCEKPFTLSSVEAKELLAQATKRELQHAVDFEFPCLPAFGQAEKRIRDGVLGAIRQVSIRWHVGSWADPARPWGWAADRAIGGGIIGALGTHTFHYIEQMIAPIRRMSCVCGTAIPVRKDASGAQRAVTAEDHAHLLMELEGGIPVTFDISNIAPRGTGHWIEIHGAKASLVLGSDYVRDYGKGFSLREGKIGSDAWVDVHVDPAPDTVIGDGRIAPFTILAGDFVQAVRENVPFQGPSFRHGWRTQLLREAALRSAEGHCWVDIPATAS